MNCKRMFMDSFRSFFENLLHEMKWFFYLDQMGKPKHKPYLYSISYSFLALNDE